MTTAAHLVIVPLALFAFAIVQPLLYIFSIWALLQLYGYHLRSANRARRAALLSNLGYRNQDGKRIVGFFHPYW